MNLRLAIVAILAAPVVLTAHRIGAQGPAENGYALVDAFPAQAKFDRAFYLDRTAVDPTGYYVVEQSGRVFRIPRDGADGARELFLDWREKTLSPKSRGHNEEGLLGFAFDPEFVKNGFLYLYYSRKTGERVLRRRGREFKLPTRESVVSRLSTRRADGRIVVDPASEFVVMRIPQPYGNHNGGTIVFGPDGMLYIALGDGGFADDPHRHGQNLGTLLAAILRIDVRGATESKPYRVPADNPFVDRKDARGEIWAYGLRNPWRMSFDRATGDLWCADVGQNIWEEVDRVVKGGNYGWNEREGLHPFPPKSNRPEGEDMIPPVAEYHHKLGVSVTGGYVYRGKALPELQGRYLYADYQSGRLWAVLEDRKDGKHAVVQLMRNAGAVASFAETVDGEILILRYDGGQISRLVRADPEKAIPKKRGEPDASLGVRKK